LIPADTNATIASIIDAAQFFPSARYPDLTRGFPTVSVPKAKVFERFFGTLVAAVSNY
jgi:hypothetical protein